MFFGDFSTLGLLVMPLLTDAHGFSWEEVPWDSYAPDTFIAADLSGRI